MGKGLGFGGLGFRVEALKLLSSSETRIDVASSARGRLIDELQLATTAVNERQILVFSRV